MSSPLFTNSFIFFSIAFLLLISNVDADVSSPPYDLANKVCSKLDNVNFCMKVLKSDSRSKFANNITTLTQIAVDVATTQATNTRDFFNGVKTGTPGVLNSLKDCIVAYNNVISSLMVCMKEEDCSLTGYDIHDASDEVKRCQQIADSNGAQDSFITTYNSISVDNCWLGESLANLMCKK